MGIAIARELQARGAEVTLVLGPVKSDVSLPGVVIKKVTTAEQMYQVCMASFPEADITVMAAAVADYTPVHTATEKIKKTGESLPLELKKTKDILKSLGELKRKNQVLAGFALETNNEEAFAREKLENKNADLIVLNSLADPGAGFGTDTNKITIFDKSGKQFDFDLKSKKAVAADIINCISSIYYA